MVRIIFSQHIISNDISFAHISVLFLASLIAISHIIDTPVMGRLQSTLANLPNCYILFINVMQ